MSESIFHVNVDPTNPGHFFACCALVDLADRLTGRAEGWFEDSDFRVRANTNLDDLVAAVKSAPFELCDPDRPDDRAPSMLLGGPFGLRIDWWQIPEPGLSGLKVWAGTMHAFRIAEAMRRAIELPKSRPEEFLDVASVVYDPSAPTKKVEPFYFDARRGPNAHSRDVGFSPNDLKLKTAAFPAVEFLCLAGLQRVRPVRLEQPRHYRYFTWRMPMAPTLLPAAAAGFMDPIQSYQFESWFRTGQKKHKAFLTAQPELIT